MNLTDFNFALIGLCAEAPKSGYALRKIFESTPIGIFSSSPGSIHPAVRKLVSSGHLRPVDETTRGSAYQPTKRGLAALKDWLTSAISVDAVSRNVDLVLLRFAFLQSQTDPAVTLQFLESFRAAVQQHITNLEAFLMSEPGKALSWHGRQAMENGVQGYHAHLQWAEQALQSFETINETPQ